LIRKPAVRSLGKGRREGALSGAAETALSPQPPTQNGMDAVLIWK
jgi:hypothetical protein